MHAEVRAEGAPQRSALRDAFQLTAPAAVAAIAATVFSGAFEASTSSAVGVGLGAAVGAGVAAWVRRSRAEQDQQEHAPRPVEPPRQVGREIAEFLPVSLFVLDARGKVLFANATASADYGPRLEGRHYSLFLRSPTLAEAVARAAKTLEDPALADEFGDAPGSAEASFAMRGQQQRYMTAFVRAVPPDNDTPWGGEAGLAPDERRAAMLIMVQDVTRARRADRLHRDFVANASHELKTPLTSISGFIETLRGPAKDDPAAHERFLAIVAEQADRMAQLVEDLLSLNRIELEEHVAPRDSVDVGAVARAALKAATIASEQRADDEGVFETDLPAGLPLVCADEKQIALALGNLISNALKYGGDARRPRIFATRRPGRRPMVGVTVEDFGAGIPKEHIPRLCERFYRAEGVATRGKAGTGLGLAIVKHVVLRHRGELEIESDVGRGSRFTIWLPEVKLINDGQKAD